MAVDPVTIGVVGVVASLALTFFTGITDFAPGACERLEPYLLSQVVGQELAIHQLCDAVCDHIQKQQPHKPLVLSVHGPPGVGKSMLHHLAAKALYNKDPITATSCPGSDCPGYKVLYGMDYILVEREQQHLLLRESLLDHLRRAPQSLIVIEEYDKLDCPTRGMFRQLLENAQTANVTMDRAVVILESNTGYTQLHEMLVQAGDRSKIAPEAAQRVLKDLVFDIWQRGECEDRTDTLKMVGLIDFFLPFLPLERPHIKQLFEMRLLEKAQQMRQSMGTDLAWDDAVLAFLTGKVDLEGAYPIEGAKEVSTIMTRYVSRALRAHAQEHKPKPAPHSKLAAASKWAQQLKRAAKKATGTAAPVPVTHRLLLEVSKDTNALLIQVEPVVQAS